MNRFKKPNKKTENPKTKTHMQTIGKFSREKIKITGNNPLHFKLNNSELYAGVSYVRESEFKKLFKENEKVLCIGLESINASESVQLIDKLKEKFNEFKTRNIKGIYFDSMNSSLRKYFTRKFNAVEIDTPERLHKEIKEHYAQKVEEKGYSEKYLNEIPKRIVLKF
jgi:choline kinase